MAYALSLTEDEVFAALGTVLAGFLPSTCPVVKGQENYVPEPPATPTGDFVVMWPTMRARLSTNVDTLSVDGAGNGTMTLSEAVRMDLQLDVHGPGSTDNAQILQTLFRDEAACDAFAALTPPVDMQPFYSEDARQVPFINAANQFEDRWIVNVSLQGNFAVSTASQYADTLKPGIIDVDVDYPP